MGGTTLLWTIAHIGLSLFGLFAWLPHDLRVRRIFAHKLQKRINENTIEIESELHHHIASFWTINRDRTIIWGLSLLISFTLIGVDLFIKPYHLLFN